MKSPFIAGETEAPMRSAALAALLAALVLLPLLGRKPLTDWDEGIYAEVAREMLRGGWLVPHWNGQLWLEKPPLMLWITAFFFRLFGVSAFAARFGSALSGVILVAVLHLWLELRVSRLTAWLSTLMLLTTFGFLHICGVGEMDTLLSLGSLISIIGVTEVDASWPPAWYLFWGGAAIALMTKGAACVVIFTAAAVFAAIQRWDQSRFGRHFWIGLLFFMIAVVPWHAAMYLHFGHQFLAEYVGLHVLSRAAEQIEGHRTHWWFYLKVILVSAPPFALLYPLAVERSIRGGPLRAFALFGIVVVVFYSAVQTRLPHYIAPLYPAFTAITAAMLANTLEHWRARFRTASFWPTSVAVAAAVYGLAAFITAHGRASLHSAVLSDGRVLPDNKEAITLLRGSNRIIQSIPGPLLVLRNGPVPINSDIFYSRRHTQQVELPSTAMGMHRDRYTDDPVPLAEAVTSSPTLILLDTSIEPILPPGLRFHVIERGRAVELGTVQLTALRDSASPPL